MSEENKLIEQKVIEYVEEKIWGEDFFKFYVDHLDEFSLYLKSIGNESLLSEIEKAAKSGIKGAEANILLRSAFSEMLTDRNIPYQESETKPDMSIKAIKKELTRPAVLFKTGGRRPEKILGESWINRVGFRWPEEDLPVSPSGKPMRPLAMIFLKDLPYIPGNLRGLYMISIFVSEDLFDDAPDENDLEQYVCVRQYDDENIDKLVPCDWKVGRSFPIFPVLLENDYPVWTDSNFPDRIFTNIFRYEKNGELNYHEDIRSQISCETGVIKLGGWPDYIQSNSPLPDGFHFAFEINSDEKADLNFIDSGSLYFYNDSADPDGHWITRLDFY